MKEQKNILLAGATGYLGSYVLKALIKERFQVLAVVRNPNKLPSSNENYLEVKQAELTKPESIKEVCKGVDTVISTVGITRQKDGLTYMGVDYQANMNLLEEAKKSGVKHYEYVSEINGNKYRNLKIFKAKEKIVYVLQSSR